MPVIALPSMSASEVVSFVSSYTRFVSKVLTMDIALSLVRLRDKQVGNVSSDMILIACGIPPKDFLQPARSSATRLTSEKP